MIVVFGFGHPHLPPSVTLGDGDHIEYWLSRCGKWGLRMLLMSGLSWQKVEVGFSNSNIRVYQTFPSLSDLHPHLFKLPSRTRTRLRKEIKENIWIIQFSERKRRKEGQPVISWSGAQEDNCFKLFFATQEIFWVYFYSVHRPSLFVVRWVLPEAFSWIFGNRQIFRGKLSTDFILLILDFL